MGNKTRQTKEHRDGDRRFEAEMRRKEEKLTKKLSAEVAQAGGADRRDRR